MIRACGCLQSMWHVCIKDKKSVAMKSSLQNPWRERTWRRGLGFAPGQKLTKVTENSIGSLLYLEFTAQAPSSGLGKLLKEMMGLGKDKGSRQQSGPSRSWRVASAHSRRHMLLTMESSAQL